MDKLVIDSPSKINIGLNVVEKREDGFHNLETFFYPLLLKDELLFEKSNQFELFTESELMLKIKENLIVKAKEIIEKELKVNLNFKVSINKNIPIGAGLGGGSSNAAVTLKALNSLFNLKLSYTKMAEMALKLGSDVPFFLDPKPAIAKSRGEKFFPVNISISYPILIVNPGIYISTKWAFERIKPGKPKVELEKIFSSEKIKLAELKELVKNDFEPIVFNEYPEIEEIKNKMYEFNCDFALMTGTGSSVFGIFSNLQDAYWAEEFFKSKNYFIFLNNPFEVGAIT